MPGVFYCGVLLAIYLTAMCITGIILLLYITGNIIVNY